jgi:hypothetical protein
MYMEASWGGQRGPEEACMEIVHTHARARGDSQDWDLDWQRAASLGKDHDKCKRVQTSRPAQWTIPCSSLARSGAGSAWRARHGKV